MSEIVQLALISAIVAPIMGLIVTIVKAIVDVVVARQQSADIAEIKHHTNSITEKLVDATRTSALQEGATTERDRATAERVDAAALSAAVAQAVELDRDRPEPDKET
jgi:hypothetical protein